MQLTFNKHTALHLLRNERAKRGRWGLPLAHSPLLAPDPSPGKRWTRRLLGSSPWGLGLPSASQRPVDVCVGKASARPRSRCLSATVYDTSVPARSFLRLTEHVAICCPELLFVELAPELELPAHLALGMELCGGFSLDAEHPLTGRASMGLAPVASVRSIEDFLRRAKAPRGAKEARRTLALLADNAWSPVEAAIAVAMALPLDESGYGIGSLELNPRFETPERLVQTTQHNSRVPDIMVAGTSVGINYDGEGHLDLDSIARAGITLGQDLGSRHREFELENAKRAVRAKALDDIRRNRELTADGLTIFQVYKEDLYEYGGLDRVMMQVLVALEKRENWDVRKQMAVLQSGVGRNARQKLVTSMMPGRAHT